MKRNVRSAAQDRTRTRPWQLRRHGTHAGSAMECCVKQDPCIMFVRHPSVADQGAKAGAGSCRQCWWYAACSPARIAALLQPWRGLLGRCTARDGWQGGAHLEAGAGVRPQRRSAPSPPAACLPGSIRVMAGMHPNLFFPHARGLPAVTRPDSEQTPAS